MPEKFNYGGQAVIEGVMIRGRTHYTVAVRRPNGQTLTKVEPLSSLFVGRLRQIPFLRGVIVLAEALALGMQALMFSANVAVEEEGKEGEQMPSWATWGMVAVSLTLAIGLFFIGPLMAIRALDRFIASSILSNVAEGGIRLAIFAGYLYAIGLLPEMRRVFAYHGAEHMTIAAHEHGAPLSVSEIRRFPKEHPRCGTAFLLVVMVVAVIVFAFLGRPPTWLRIVSRIVLIPVIAAVSYEVIRFNASHAGSFLSRLVIAPGLALQALTTRVPDDSQIEVAMSAMRTALAADGEPVTHEEPSGAAVEPFQPAASSPDPPG